MYSVGWWGGQSGKGGGTSRRLKLLQVSTEANQDADNGQPSSSVP